MLKDVTCVCVEGCDSDSDSSVLNDVTCDSDSAAVLKDVTVTVTVLC